MSDAAPAYAPATRRAGAAIVGLYVKVGASLLAIGAAAGRIIVAGDLGDRPKPEPEEVAAVGRLLHADDLVQIATVVEVVALVVAVALVMRWLLVVRGNRAAVGAPGAPLDAPARLRRVWLAALSVAVLAELLVWTVLGGADTVADRQRIDALRAGAAALSAMAAGLTIAVVAAVSARQERRALELGAVGADAGADLAGHVSEGGLQVVSEEQARRGSGAH